MSVVAPRAAALLLLAAAACDWGRPRRREPPDPLPTPAPVPAPVDASPWLDDEQALPAGDAADGAPIATADPIQWALGDPARRWVVVCQARADTDHDGVVGNVTHPDPMVALGDAPATYLVLGSGPGRPIDAVVRVAHDGDHLLVRIDGALAVVDATTRRARRLPDATAIAAFSGDGTRLVYVDREAPPHLVRRELATGAETRRDLPAGKPALLDLDTSGRWAVVAIARGGDRGTRFLDASWPQRYPCALNPIRGWTDVGYDTREPVERVWIDLDTGVTRDDPELVRVVADHAVARHDDAVLVDGERIAGCRTSNVLGVHEAPFAVLVGCWDGARERTLLVGGRKRIELDGRIGAGALRLQLAAMIHDREDCEDLPRTCFDVVTGRRRARRFVLLPYDRAIAGGERRYEATRTHLLVGAPDRGPLRWRPQTAADR